MAYTAAAGQGMVFGYFVVNRVYNFYVSVLKRPCILPFVLTEGPKMKDVVLTRIGILGYFSFFFLFFCFLFFGVQNRVRV